MLFVRREIALSQCIRTLDYTRNGFSPTRLVGVAAVAENSMDTTVYIRFFIHATVVKVDNVRMESEV